MLSRVLLFAIVLGVSFQVNAQRYFTKNGKINFDATTKGSPESIAAVNRTVTCVLDTKTAALQFAVLIKGFTFERALMEEHFNENYLESSKFPKAEFRGTITNNSAVNYAKDGTYPVTVAGKLTIHGVTKDVESPGKLQIQGGKVLATASFTVPLADYGIAIPGVVADKVAKNAKIDIDCSLEPLKN
jgi:hypothetical protein